MESKSRKKVEMALWKIIPPNRAAAFAIVLYIMEEKSVLQGQHHIVTDVVCLISAKKEVFRNEAKGADVSRKSMPRWYLHVVVCRMPILIIAEEEVARPRQGNIVLLGQNLAEGAALRFII